MDGELRAFFECKLSEGALIQWLVEDQGEVVACGAVLFYEFPPSYMNKTGKKAYISNMFTDENYRGRGIAKELLTKLIPGGSGCGNIENLAGSFRNGETCISEIWFYGKR